MIILDIEYEDDYLSDMFVDLNDVIHSKGLMQIEIGTELTRAVKRRYNQIISFDSFFDLQQSCLGKCESLTGNLKGCFSVHLTRNFRLIVKTKSNDLSA